jgi:predicted lipid-binding transport protein (Tim44 family)
MKIASIAALGLALMMGLASINADAKRLGAGKSTGMQREMPARTAPDAAPGKPAAPAQQAAPATAPNAAAAPAAAPKRNWMGPLAGLAAGLGLAALMSHLGLGEAFGSFLLMALLAVAAFFLIRMFMRRKQQPQPAGMAYTGNAGSTGQVAWPTPAPASSGNGAAADPVMPAPATPAAPEAAAVEPAVAAVAAPAKAFVPAAFDAEGFARTAKMIFIRLQAANDAADLNDLRAFTTPEMFAELSMDLRDRPAGHQQTTEVVSIESEVLDVTDEVTQQVVSVRFRGQVREEAGAQPVAVDEVWHLTKPTDGSRSWAIAGIEQWQGSKAA